MGLISTSCAEGIETNPPLEDPEAEVVDPPADDPFGDPGDPGDEPLEDEGDLDDDFEQQY